MPHHRLKGRFVSTSASNKIKQASDTLKQKWNLQKSLDDHSYFSSTSSTSNLPDISILGHEEFVKTDDTHEQLTLGRRVVELDILADGLKACISCGGPLHLHHCIGIQTFGLAAVLSVKCYNFNCQALNKISTGKKHGKTFDMNTKLATATVHSGQGVTQINGVLACLNIPPVSHDMLDARLRETGQAIEEVAKESIELCLQEEVSLEGASNEIEASVDAGWQKRGCGRSYDSLSGHCTMIGCQTGKVVGYAVRSKQCRVCESGVKNLLAPTEHDCRKNWDGSAKAMEADMVAEMVQTIKNKGITTRAIIGDDDSSTIARLRSTVDYNISKRSDKNHVRKTLSNALYVLQKHHAALTTRVIKYIVKCFNYMLAQNVENPDGICEGLQAVCKHPFGDHSNCQDSWCRMKGDNNARYSTLPYGKPLKDGNLKHALEELFRSYLKHSVKLSKLGSTQGNESLNRTISSKAPKSQHFSGSASLNFRVSASVAQKNMGQRYLLTVHKKLGISPGVYTSKLATLRDIQSRKRKAISTTRKAKQRRIKLKQERSQKRVSVETREGPTYQSNLELEHCGDIPVSELPAASQKPISVVIETKNPTEIYFDLETTGLGRTAHIVQLAARRGDDVLELYIVPKKQMTPKASEVTNIHVVGKHVYCRNVLVPSVDINTALDNFITFLSESDENVLIGHNIQTFDCPVLMNALYSCGKVDMFKDHCSGFIDTRKLFMKTHPDVKPHSQQGLIKNLLKEDYNAHNALDDVTALQRLVNHIEFTKEQKLSASFSVMYSVNMHIYHQIVNTNLPSLQKCVHSKVLSLGMARKIAGSGLSLQHLVLAYTRQGYTGIDNLFSEKYSNKTVRVTKSQKIIGSVVDFLCSLQK